MVYCDNCGGVGGDRLTIPRKYPLEPVHLIFCDTECRAALVRKYTGERPELQLLTVEAAARQVS